MAENRLNIINEPSSESSFLEQTTSSRTVRAREMQAKFERLWLLDPQSFNPLRNCMERERLERTWVLLNRHVNPSDKQTADIGCASGVFSRRLRDAGARVKAADIAKNALKRFEAEDSRNIELKQDAMPATSLPDHGYDIIICTELIAELCRDDYRLFFAELSRLIRPDGYLVCSSPIDIYSEGGVEKLIELSQTEFDIIDAISSYHALYVRLKYFFETPSRMIEAWEKPDFRSKEIASRHGLSLWWFWLNTTIVFIWIWYGLKPLAYPFLNALRNNRKLLLWLEKICRFFWDDAGISHYLFIAKRRKLKVVEPKDIPIEKPKRKEIWE